MGIDAGELFLACVVRLDRGFPAVVSAAGLMRAEFAANLSKASGPVGGKDDLGELAAGRVAVGDWVCLRVPSTHDKALICEIMPRTTEVARWRGGSRGQRQTLAANVDVVMVARALGAGPIDCLRVARAAVVAADCGTRVAVVLTKADRVSEDELAEDLRRLCATLGDELPVVVTAASRGEGADAVRALVPAGVTAIVLGESGAGKSTLLNLLLGQEALETGAVRESDDAGRHTTVARRMVAIPEAGIIVDEPGLRTLALAGHERGLAKVFPAIAAAARGCRFSDCTHTHEPGCAVREALAEGAFTQEALDTWISLATEMRAGADSLDPDIVL
jgi:ribosome biogenesis GTPase